MDGGGNYSEYSYMTEDEIRSIPHIGFKNKEACLLFWSSPKTTEDILDDLYNIMDITNPNPPKKFLKCKKVKGTKNEPNKYIFSIIR